MSMLYWFLLMMSVIYILVGVTILYNSASRAKTTSISLTRWNERLPELSKKNVQRSRVAVVSHDDRQGAAFVAQLRDKNHRYCQKHGYDFYWYDHTDDQWCPYWLKVKLVGDLLMNNAYDFVMWIDSDACFHQHEIRVENLFAQFGTHDHFMIIGPDPPGNPAIFNTGAWILRNCQMAKDFMKQWMNHYEHRARKQWSHIAGKWTCEGCIWAGNAYEQGVGGDLIAQSKYQPYVICLPYEAIQSHHPAENAFTLHFMAQWKEKIGAYLQNEISLHAQ